MGEDLDSPQVWDIVLVFVLGVSGQAARLMLHCRNINVRVSLRSSGTNISSSIHKQVNEYTFSEPFLS
jgi:hypothetical protein